MAVYSMTGYATGQEQAAAAPGGEAETSGAAHSRLTLELRSVNSRFLDLSFRLPDELRAYEPALREAIGKQVRRGKVELRASLQASDAGAVAEPTLRLMQRLAAVQDQVRAWLPDAGVLSVADVLRAAAHAEAAHAPPSADVVLALLRQVLKEFTASRSREGARLVKLMRERIAQLRQLAAEAGPLVPQAVATQKERFLARWNEALAAGDASVGADAAQERALAEATAFAIRIDVAEELGRLAAHLDEIDAVLDKGGEVGKRLDFLIQELHREANTLGSKSAALPLTRIAVEMKVAIEQLREQVQNLE